MRPTTILAVLFGALLAIGLISEAKAQGFQIEPPQCTLGAGPQQVVTEGGTCPSSSPLSPYQLIKIIDSPDGATCSGAATGGKFLLCMADSTGAMLAPVVAPGGGGSGNVVGPPTAIPGNVPEFVTATELADSGHRIVVLPTGSPTSPYLCDFDGDGAYASCELVAPINAFSLTDGSVYKSAAGQNSKWLLGTGTTPSAMLQFVSTANCPAVAGGTLDVVDGWCIESGTTGNIYMLVAGAAVPALRLITSADCTLEDAGAIAACKDPTGWYLNDGTGWSGPL